MGGTYFSKMASGAGRKLNMMEQKTVDEIFNKIDSNRNGQLENEEIIHWLQVASQSIQKESDKQAASEFIQRLQADKGGQISRDEMTLHLQRRKDVLGVFHFNELLKSYGKENKSQPASQPTPSSQHKGDDLNMNPPSSGEPQQTRSTVTVHDGCPTNDAVDVAPARRLPPSVAHDKRCCGCQLQ